MMALHPLVINVEVTPEQGHRGWELVHGDKLKTYHKEPESRDANEFLIKTLAEILHLSHSHITLIKGVESRFKEIKIGKDITFEQLLDTLNIKRP